jgi:phosphoenolpyruvate synthase/pyruvate phosphate dikinase
MSLEKVQQSADLIFENWIHGGQALDTILHSSGEEELALDRVWKKYKPKKNINDKQLAKIFRQAIEISQVWWRYNSLAENKGIAIDRKVVPYFSKKYGWGFAKAQDIVSTLAHPEEQSAFNRERMDFLKICINLQSNAKIQELVKAEKIDEALTDEKLSKMVKKYIKHSFWVKSDFCRTIEITPELILGEAVVEIEKKDAKVELRDLKKKLRKIEKEKIQLQKEVELDEEDWKNIAFAEKIIFWLDERKRQMMKQFCYLFRLLEDIGRRHELSYEEMIYLKEKEIEEMLLTGNKYEKERKKRQEKCFFMYDHENVYEFYGSDAQELLDEVLNAEKEEEIRGMVASKGKEAAVKGIARIVHNPYKDTFSDQEILVTSMTRVEFVPLMRRAKAILTNEGGLACHAAIVSRELGIPCVIGTKNATKILKDGDEIEMDLEKGIVKILN